MGHIKVTQSGPAAVLSIDRPEALNALSRALVDELDEMLEQLAASNEIKALILYGPRNFAAGADIRDMAGCTPEQASTFSFTPTFNRLGEFPVPTIAAMEGYALGGGLELALACDLRIAGESCKMGFPEITLGIMPGGGGTARAPRLVGTAKAMELIFTGSVISAPEALRIGLVNQTVPDGEVLPQAQKLAGRISAFSRTALETAKQTILEGARHPSVLSAAAVEYRNWPSLFATQDQKEGMRAFLEKRKPVFTDR